MSKPPRPRNRPCSCGSGKQFKKCCRGKKPRLDRAVAISRPIGEAFPDGKIPAGLWTITPSATGVKIDVGGTAIPMVPGFQLQSAYEREGKHDKVLRQMPVESLGDIRELLDPDAIHRHCCSYDQIFVIDTNTRTLDGRLHSAAFALACRAVPCGNGMEFHYAQHAIFRCRGLSPDQAEKRGVVALIGAIQRNPAYRPNQKIAVVTDHDLGSHVAINARDVPMWGAGLLPTNFSLLYASADGGKENVLNRAMAICDACASQVLDLPYPASGPKR